MAPASSRIDSKSTAPAAENTPAVPVSSGASPRQENWRRGGRCRPAARERPQKIERFPPRHNARPHLGSGFLHGVGRHALPVTPGGNPARGNPRCSRQDQSRSGQDQIRSELLGLMHRKRQGTAWFVERGAAGQERPAPFWKELGTWPTSQPSDHFPFCSPCQPFSFPRPLPPVPSFRPCLLRNANAIPPCPALARLLKSTHDLLAGSVCSRP